MNKRELKIYHEEQMKIILNNSCKLNQQGLVESYEDVYPDVCKYLGPKKRVAYIRGRVSIKMMALLYDVVIVYIPSYAKEVLEKRFALNDWDELIRLCQQGIVIPIIGRAEEYTAKHFNDLFKELPKMPYSLWARGLALLDVFGMSDTLEIAREVLPVDKIAEDKRIFNYWKKIYTHKDEDFIKDRIKKDIAVQYADLCIFGCENEAKAFALEKDTKLIYDGIKLLNEIRTYPILFGMQSQANIDCSKLNDLAKLPISTQINVQQSLPERELKILFDGIGININEIGVSEIIAYHQDHLGELLRTALSSFNEYCDGQIRDNKAVDISQVLSRAETLQHRLSDAIDDLKIKNYYKDLDDKYRNTTAFLSIGAIVAGQAIAFCSNPTNANGATIASITTLAGTGGLIIAKFPQTIASMLVRLGMQRRNKFVANMWYTKKVIGKK